ncbi:MAG TPA: WD40 repeat domain-containing protein [Polyangiaceae bacterium]|nr:WD40 repeat domain-containing protein [Polyangiaceae bacterium]
MTRKPRGGLLPLLLALLNGAACSGSAVKSPANSSSVSSPDRTEAPPPAPGSAPLVQATSHPEPGKGARSIGKCQVREERSAVWELPAPQPAQLDSDVKYARFRQRKVIPVGYSHLSIAHFAPDTRTLLAVSENEAALRLYDAATGKLLAKNSVRGYEQYGRGDFTFWGPSDPTHVLFAHDHGIELLDGLSGQQLRTASEHGSWQLEWSEAGNVLMATLPELKTQTSSLALYTRASNGGLDLALLIDCPERIDGMFLDASNRRLAVSHYPANEVSLLDLQSGAELLRVRGPQYARSVALSPDGELLAVGGNAVWLFSTRSADRKAEYTRFDNNVHDVHFSPNGKVIVASAYDGRARLLEHVAGAKELRLVRELRHAGTANVYEAEFSRDGRLLLTSSGDKTLRIWGE